jgi:integral membrane protein (TIGR01906 family)
MKSNRLSILFTVIFIIAVVLFIITVSIGLPIYLRFFYYLHINALDLPQKTGYDYATIKQAYDQMLNYLTLPNTEFSTGVFAFSKDGASHFADCKVLFNLNAITLIVSTIVITTLLILSKFKKITLCRPMKMHACFISALSVLGVFVIIALLCAIDFNKAFVIFHKIFFAGKDNWTFSPQKDQIIKVLPQQFFMNCGILIVSSIVLICVGIIVFQTIMRRKHAKKTKNIDNELTEV